MEGIFKKDNVYVVIKYKSVRNDVDLKELEDYIVGDSRKREANLYGGRVFISYEEMYIDGIQIREYNLTSTGDASCSVDLSYNKMASYLNQIENLGVDTFLENYKLQLLNFKKELEAMATNIEHDLSLEQNDSMSATLKSIRKVLLNINFVILSLLINLNAGLDNLSYINAYDTILSLYF